MFYTRKTKAGEFLQINKYMLTDLEECNAWNKAVQNLLKEQEGSIAGISKLFPFSDHVERLKFLERKYQTIFELRQRKLMDITAARGPYIDGSQSMSLYFQKPTIKKVVNAWIYAWEKGLKTLQYYCRTKPVALPIKFTARTSSGGGAEIQIGDDNTAIARIGSVSGETSSDEGNFDIVNEEEIPMCRRDDPECTSCN
jgi:ribonucleotide reductase alpha subunit